VAEFMDAILAAWATMSRMSVRGAVRPMHLPNPLVFALILLACRPQGPRAFGDTLERGGVLAHVQVEDMTVRISDTTVSTWGLLEVPDGSRLEAAYAGADAIARAELLKLIRVRVAGVMVSVDSTDPARRAASEYTVEAVQGTLRRAGSIQRGWARVRQDARLSLRVWSQLTVPRADVQAALQAAHTEADIALPDSADAELRPAPNAP